jgi:tetratricopeptide (TPR) repeat protein
MSTLVSRRALHSRIFGSYLSELRVAAGDLYQRRTESVEARIKVWYSNWVEAYAGVVQVAPPDIVRFGLLLGRLAESYSVRNVAEEILDQLADDAVGRVPWIDHPAEILITAGEFNRRRGDLPEAERRFGEAVAILEEDLALVDTRQQAHRELGRVFYEFAYLNRLRGDAAAATSAIERSEAECELGADIVGVEIAKSLHAAALYEEGMPEAAVAKYRACLVRFEELVADPAIEEAGRVGFARRWLVNTKIHLGQAYLSAGNYDDARSLIESQVAAVSNGPSSFAVATTKRVEAQLRLAENDIIGAEAAIAASWNIIRGDESSAESAAATLAITGVTHALAGDHPSALSCFNDACRLSPDLHNHRAQGWAWAGQAILAKASGNRELSRSAVIEGLKCVERCGAPVRSFLLDLLRTNHKEDGPGLDELRQLVYRAG